MALKPANLKATKASAAEIAPPLSFSFNMPGTGLKPASAAAPDAAAEKKAATEKAAAAEKAVAAAAAAAAAKKAAELESQIGRLVAYYTEHEPAKGRPEVTAILAKRAKASDTPLVTDRLANPHMTASKICAVATGTRSS